MPPDDSAFKSLRHCSCSSARLAARARTLRDFRPSAIDFLTKQLEIAEEVRAMRGGGNGDQRNTRTHTDVLRLVLFHLHDWVLVFALLILDRVLAVLHPYSRFVGEFMLDELRYPQKKSTVPFSAVPVITIVGPIIIFSTFYFKNRDIRDVHHATLGVLFSVMLAATITDALKDFMGRPRPDFFWRCFPDGQKMFNNITGEVICHGDPKGIREGHKSFPSGHTAWSFSGLGFLSLYLAGKIRVFDKRGHIAKLIIVISPLVLASFIGLSRINDYKHHWQDVFVAAVLAWAVATLCYRQFFPVPYHENCMQPYAVIPVSEEVSSSSSIPPDLHSRPANISVTSSIPPDLHSRPANISVTRSGQSSVVRSDLEIGRIHTHASDEWMGI